MTENPQAPSPRPADAVPRSWVDRTPVGLQPWLRLMRLDRPIGVWLLFWPCVFGQALGAAAAGHGTPNLYYVALFVLGSIVMRGAGCTYNDIVDRDIDAKVERTRGRPIPSGAIGVHGAWIFAIAQSLAGLAILLQFNTFTIWLGASSLVLIAAYPFMKRITWWPQAWLGLTFNWGALMGFAAEAEYLAPSALLAYAGCFFWTLGYDTIYAHQDKEDDALTGVKSSARFLGAATRPWLILFYGMAVALFLAAGLAQGLGGVFAALMIVPAAHLFWQARTIDIDRPQLCLRLFRSNRDTGAAIAFALLVGTATVH